MCYLLWIIRLTNFSFYEGGSGQHQGVVTTKERLLCLVVTTPRSFDEIFFCLFEVATTGGNGGSLSNGGIIFDNNNNFDNGGFDNTNLDPDINCDRLGTCYDGNFLVCI